MSLGAGPNPFQSMAGATPRKPSPVPKIIAVATVLFVLLVVGVIVLPKIRYIGGGLTHGLYTKEDAAKLSDKELWNAFNDDEEMANKKFKDRWIVVTGECSDVEPFQPDGSALNEQYAVQLGRTGTRLNVEWLVDCNIPRANLKDFARAKAGGILSVRGRCKGREGTNQVQVMLKECEFVSFSIK